jgi:hypothetical protein
VVIAREEEEECVGADNGGSLCESDASCGVVGLYLAYDRVLIEYGSSPRQSNKIWMLGTLRSDQTL